MRMEVDGFDVDWHDDVFFPQIQRGLLDYVASEQMKQVGGNETAPPDAVQLYFRTSEGMFYLTMVLNSLVMLICSVSVLFIIVYRKHRILSLAQPEFLCIICFGSALIAASGVVLDYHGHRLDNDTPESLLNRLCSQYANEFFAGHIIVYMALFAKIWRIQRVTRFRRHQTVHVRHVILPAIIMELVTIGVLVAWSILAPPSFATNEVATKDANGQQDTIRAVGYCDFTSGNSGFFLLTMLVLMLTSALLGYCMAKKIPARVPDELHDGKQIRQLYVCHFIVVVCSLILYKVARSFALSLIFDLAELNLVFLLTMTNIALLIAPKCYGVWFEQRHNGELPISMQGNRIGTGTVQIHGISSTAATPTDHGPTTTTDNVTITEQCKNVHPDG